MGGGRRRSVPGDWPKEIGGQWLTEVLAFYSPVSAESGAVSQSRQSD